MPTQSEIDAADRRAREWRWPDPDQVAIGSDRHRNAACRMFRDTFNPYKPSVIAWPTLDPEALRRLTSLPIWDIAVSTENKARARMRAYGEVIADPQWREAIIQNGWEEGRHREVLANLVTSYGIRLAPEQPDQPPADPEWGYLVTGYSECIDSFFAFGLFELARRSGFFPSALVDTFEPVIQEEARHILLFANWLAWHRRQLGVWHRLRFEWRVARAWIFLTWERIGLARGMDSGKQPDNNFTLNGSQAVSDASVGPLDLMAICLAENDRRFAGYDPRLLRPVTTLHLPGWQCVWAARSAGARQLGQITRRYVIPVCRSAGIGHNIRIDTGQSQPEMSISKTAFHRFIVASALCAMAGLMGSPAQARVFVGIGVPFFGPGYYPPPVYYPPPPVYYAPPPVVYAPPPQVYAPPPSTAVPGQSCYAASYVCPMDRPVAPGSGCYCLGNGGQRIWGRAS